MLQVLGQPTALRRGLAKPAKKSAGGTQALRRKGAPRREPPKSGMSRRLLLCRDIPRFREDLTVRVEGFYHNVVRSGCHREGCIDIGSTAGIVVDQLTIDVDLNRGDLRNGAAVGKYVQRRGRRLILLRQADVQAIG